MPKEIVTYRLRVPEEIWKLYKESVSKAQTMNEDLLEMIKAKVGYVGPTEKSEEEVL